MLFNWNRIIFKLLHWKIFYPSQQRSWKNDKPSLKYKLIIYKHCLACTSKELEIEKASVMLLFSMDSIIEFNFTVTLL